jgi:hypothetical protein
MAEFARSTLLAELFTFLLDSFEINISKAEIPRMKHSTSEIQV